MRTTLRRRWRLVAALVAILALVAASCGGDDDEPGAAEPTEEEPAAEPAADEPDEPAAEPTEEESAEEPAAQEPADEPAEEMADDGAAADSESAQLQNIASMALILPGPISDADYNAVGFEALNAVSETLGIEVAHNEQTPVPDATRIAESFIADGFDVIAFHGGQFLSAALELSAEFPDTQFLVQSAGPLQDQPHNIYNIGRLYWTGYYAVGAMAALATQTGTVAFLGGIEIPDFRAAANAFFAGAREADPDVGLLSNFTGDFNDPVAGRQGAEALIGGGADVLALALNNAITGVAEAAGAADNRVLFTSSYTDKSNLAPDLFVTAVELDFEEAFEAALRAMDAGTAAGYYEMRPGQSIRLTELRNLDPDVEESVTALFDAMADGSLVVEPPSFGDVTIPER